MGIFDWGNAIGGIAGGLGSLFGSSKSASAAKAAAEISRNWEREKLQNAYQYTVKDLKAAGLNPILAVQNGPNSAGSINTPMPDYSGYTAAGQRIGEALARDIKRDEVKAYKTGLKSQIEKNLSDMEVNKQNILSAKKHVENLELQNELIRLQVPGMKNRANYQQSKVGKALQYIGFGLQDVAPAVGMVGAGAGSFIGSTIGTARSAARVEKAIRKMNKMKETSSYLRPSPKMRRLMTQEEIFRNLSTFERGQMRGY